MRGNTLYVEALKCNTKAGFTACTSLPRFTAQNLESLKHGCKAINLAAICSSAGVGAKLIPGFILYSNLVTYQQKCNVCTRYFQGNGLCVNPQMFFITSSALFQSFLLYNNFILRVSWGANLRIRLEGSSPVYMCLCVKSDLALQQVTIAIAYCNVTSLSGVWWVAAQICAVSCDSIILGY